MNDLNVQKNGLVTEDIASVTLRDIFNIVFHNWHWFLLSVLLCLSVAVVYLMWTPKVYERSATVLIKDDKSSSGETALFQDLTIFEGKNNVNNEMIVFKSFSLMTEAVRRLKIDISYTRKERIRTLELYTKTPVVFSFFNIEDNQSASVKAKLLPDNKIALWDFYTNNIESAQQIIVNLNDTVNTPIGNIMAAPTLWYNEAWFYETITVTKSVLKGVVNHYRQAMNVSLADKQTSVIKLSINDVSIQRAEDVLNTIIAIYNEEAINDKNIMAINTENFINERLIILEEELGKVDAKIQTYKTVHQLTDIKSDVQIALQESSEANRAILALQTQRAMVDYIRKYLTDPANSKEMIPANTGVEDMKLESQITNYNLKLITRNKLIESSSDRNPVVQDYNNSLNAMRQSIMRAVDNMIVNLDIQINSARARNERTRARIAAVPQQTTDVTSISRQQQIKEGTFAYLLNKREENALNKAITESTARIIDAATGSSGPVAPRSQIILMAAFFLGLAMPAAVIYLMMMSDITVRRRKDLTSVLSIPFLGEIPFKKSKSIKNLEEVLVQQHGRDHVSEAFRIIRTNMDFMRVKQDQLKVIMVTSINIGSGKTFVAANLAASLALAGKKTLLIDMDIRKGTLSKKLGINHTINVQETGLTNYLSKNIDNLDSLIIPYKNLDNIDIICAGPEPPNPAELLLSPRLDELIIQVRDLYDYVVVDNVPCGIVADAFISNRIADLTLFIVRSGKLDRRMLPDLEQLYQDEKLKNMALILNGIDTGVKYYDYSYGYHYGYSYPNKA